MANKGRHLSLVAHITAYPERLCISVSLLNRKPANSDSCSASLVQEAETPTDRSSSSLSSTLGLVYCFPQLFFVRGACMCVQSPPKR